MATANARFLAFVLTSAVLAFAFPVQAGTADAPEVVDASGDAATCAQPPACLPSQDDLDINATWVDVPDGLNVAFHLRLAAAPTAVGVAAGTTLPDQAPLYGGSCPNTSVTKVYALHFRTLDANGTPLVTTDANNGDAELLDVYAVAQTACDAAGGENVLGFQLDWLSPDGASNARSEVAVNGSLEGDVLTWIIPRNATVVALPLGDAAASYQIGGLVANTYVTAFAAGAGLSEPPVAPDRAPDAGNGTVFVFPLPAPEPEPETNATAPPTSASTVTVVQTRTETQVVTETQSFVETVTATFAPSSSSSKVAPGAGILVLVGIVALAAVRRRLD